MATRNIVIIGGGIIGCTTAYYLTEHPNYNPSTCCITILEASAHGAAQGASGKAGGLVAKWAYPKELVDVSFTEHERLAQRYNGKERWGWRYVIPGTWEGIGEPIDDDPAAGTERLSKKTSLEKTVGLDSGAPPPPTRSANPGARRNKGLPDDLNWVKESLTKAYLPMASPGDTAQVHPYLFTTAMLGLAKEKGAKLVSGKATSIEMADGWVTGVKYQDNETGDSRDLSGPGLTVILAAGAWSPSLISGLPISATRAHSVVIRTKPDANIAPYALFTEIRLTSKETVTPEIYARPNNQVYACGPGDTSPLPPTVDDVEVDPVAIDNLYKRVITISQELREGKVERRQACFLPSVSSGGGPIVGEASHIAKGLYVATGHTCWGINNAPGTAKALTELIMDGKIKCANLTKLGPSEYM